ncbi:glycoside hydrolase [Fistulina hepatica ATCC 64428]|uniref:alpha-galactosidase n=1 Tax=Fistulina hepatica ATCC 64428 TaxID=1128425 RepID=A0A0D7A5F1_9AGAR|nr:glycoside hydrolase [Fistulina hepatica ATCC 64428]
MPAINSQFFETQQVLTYTTTTPNGFYGPTHGWNSFGLQANPTTMSPSFVFNQTSVMTQCEVLATTLAGSGYTYCSLDSGWSIGDHGDVYGRLVNEPDIFPNMTALADYLHAIGLQLGVYVVPGAFISDENKTVYDTDVVIGSICSGDNGLDRCNFNYTLYGVQEWHNSVVNLFAEWGVDFIKLDFITPGSPSNGANLPDDSSGAVLAFHRAIAQASRPMRLNIGWKLDRSRKLNAIWNQTSESVRVDQDINNGGSSTFVDWSTVQRTIDNYRSYISVRRRDDGVGVPMAVHPSLDALYVGNNASVSGVTDVQRQTIMTHWIGAGADLIIDSDLTNLDDFGIALLTNNEALAVADFTARYPMQPRNPGTGGYDSQQLQAWIAGPGEDGMAIVVLVNYGPDLASGGYATYEPGTLKVSVTWRDLGLAGNSYSVRDVWNDQDLGVIATGLSATLDEGESTLYIVQA